jgi:CDGSH-type Zn-finger protein
MAKTKKEAEKAGKYKVKVTPNGPYLVSGGAPLSEQLICVNGEKECHGWKEGKRFPVPENYALCRCGQSGNKPFCDGTHVKVKFNGKEEASRVPYMERSAEVRGPALKLTDARDLCSEARFCHRAGGTWNLTNQSADPEARQKAVEEACDCPSGRLVAWDNEGKPVEPVFEASIGLIEDTQAGKMGPLWVRGGISVESADGAPYEVRNRVTLCRCGKSANKPYCDGAHLI